MTDQGLIGEHEPIPSEAEVHALFRELIKTAEYTVTRKFEDERGLYFLEVSAPGEKEGEMTEYLYMRKGKYQQGQSLTTEITVTYYEDDMPVGGTSAARYVDGEWKIL